MNILGLSFFYHDAAAALLKDGVLVAAGEEERFSRKKHDPGFPVNAVRFCLERAGIQAQDLDYVVFYEKPFLKFERILVTSFATFPKSMAVFRESMLKWLTEKLWVKSVIAEKLGISKKKIIFADHHMSHAASAFYCSPFEEAAILTVDGAGEWSTSTQGVGRGTQIDIQREMRFPHSIGLLYSAFTAYCGFEVNEGEYKLMGMAPYGVPRYVDKIKQIIRIGEDGSLWHDMSYFAYHYSASSTLAQRFSDHFGKPPRDPKEQDKSLDPYYCDVAASIQAVTEEILIKMAKHLQKTTGSKHLCIAGGVGLNCVANAKILRDCGFDQLYVHPAAGDDGGAVGAALWAYHGLLGKPRGFVMEHAYWGSEYSSGRIREFLDKAQIPYEEIGDEGKLCERVADDLLQAKVCGWYQGRFEWGPRALGARSIIADAGHPDMKDIVNSKIKFREAFRPFAPSVLTERCEDLFELPNAEKHYPARFMLYVVPVKDGWKEKLPSITHVDGTGRVQCVRKDTAPRYYRLIETFGQASGRPVILNTSFNLKGEPIVETPANAYATFMRSGMDSLILGDFYIDKKKQKTSGGAR
jgi:carbamoyltransferase